MGRAMQDVRDRVAAVQPAFPRDAKAPLVVRFDNENAQPTVVLALLGKDRSARELSMLADQVVAKRLQRVDGVARVDAERAGRAPGAHRSRRAAAARSTA